MLTVDVQPNTQRRLTFDTPTRATQDAINSSHPKPLERGTQDPNIPDAPTSRLHGQKMLTREAVSEETKEALRDWARKEKRRWWEGTEMRQKEERRKR
jgi:hypothetical protein